jgi:hypothetical protein
VTAHQIKELAILLFDGAHNLNLLLYGQRRQIPAKALSAHRIGSFQPIPVSIPMALVGPGELVVDVSDHSGLRAAGKVIRGDNPITHRGQRQSLDIAEEIPASVATGRAANSEGRAAYGSGSHKLPPRETNAILAPWHWFLP